MDTQTISVATGVVSTAVAAFGLLLGWYLREENRKKQKSRRFFIAACAGIITLATVGVTVTFLLGSGAKVSADAGDSGASTQLTEVQYRGQVGAVCSDAKERARRIQELRPQETVLGYVIQIEQDQVAQIIRLRPPDALKDVHADVVSIWQRRIGLLESIYRQSPQIGDGEQLVENLAAADRIAADLANLFKSLGVPECII